jgi:hypothetical protein
LLEKDRTGQTLLPAVNVHLQRNGIKIADGTIVDGSIIGAPSSISPCDCYEQLALAFASLKNAAL